MVTAYLPTAEELLYRKFAAMRRIFTALFQLTRRCVLATAMSRRPFVAKHVLASIGDKRLHI